jgi:hypothetical protein
MHNLLAKPLYGLLHSIYDVDSFIELLAARKLKFKSNLFTCLPTSNFEAGDSHFKDVRVVVDDTFYFGERISVLFSIDRKLFEDLKQSIADLTVPIDSWLGVQTYGMPIAPKVVAGVTPNIRLSPAYFEYDINGGHFGKVEFGGTSDNGAGVANVWIRLNPSFEPSILFTIL